MKPELLVADHEQPTADTTLTVPVPAAESKVLLVGVTQKLHCKTEAAEIEVRIDTTITLREHRNAKSQAWKYFG